MPLSKKTSLFRDLRAVFFVGFGLLIVGSLTALVDQHPGGGFVAIAGSILIAAAVIGNSICPTPSETEDAD
jgi:predicted membrane channel-forming protein YqfA (hemolysin III family)